MHRRDGGANSVTEVRVLSGLRRGRERPVARKLSECFSTIFAPLPMLPQTRCLEQNIREVKLLMAVRHSGIASEEYVYDYCAVK
jgi:hypothetical protein